MFYAALCVNTPKKHDRSSQFDVVREENNTLVIVDTVVRLAETEEKSDWPHSKFPVATLL